MPTPTVAVITPTIGNPQLERCIKSVAAQEAPCMHVIVSDGPQHHEEVCRIVSKLRAKGILNLDNHRLLQLPFNTGANKMNGHRIYAAIPWLVNTDWVAFLDEDNWYEPNHISAMLQAVGTNAAGSKGMEWVHSLRSICSDEGHSLVKDCCESLGLLHPTWDRPGHFCDTSTLMLRRSLACKLAPLWDVPLVADRYISAQLVKDHMGTTSASHSLNYTVGDNHSCGVTAAYFRKGNAALGGRTWEGKKPLYVFHFGPQNTQRLMQHLYDRRTASPLDDWQLTQFDALDKHFALLDGYTHEHRIPVGAHVFINWTHTNQHLPWKTLKRADIHKHTLLVESPNIRHTQQWDDELLHMFTTVLTFWRNMLVPELPMCKFAPMNCHWLNHANPAHCALCVDNHVDDRSVGMVLAHRPGLQGTFVVRDTVLQCQDPLRLHYVKDLDDATVYGHGWEGAAALGPGVHVGGFQPNATSIDLLSRHTFGLVVENVNADGYVSEKLYDCLMAGAIPLYYGNNNELVGVPPDMFADIRQFATSRALQAHLDTIDIAAFKQRIIEGRAAVLQRVSAGAFAQAVKDAVHSGGVVRLPGAIQI
jgi:glycosyltransferase involved in cell wall biosynthesis